MRGYPSFSTVGVAVLSAVLSAVVAVPASARLESRPVALRPKVVAAAVADNGVVVDSLTTPTRLVTRDPESGTMRAELSAMPVRQRDPDGVWRPVEPSLERRGDRLIPKRVPTSMSFSAGGAGDLALIRDGGRELGLAWPTTLPTPVVSGATATYPQVWPGVDLGVQAGVTGFSTFLVVRSASAAKDPRVRDFALTAHSSGVSLRPGDAGGLTGVDATGQVAFTTSQPRMWDSAGAPRIQASEGAGDTPFPAWQEHAGSRSRAMKSSLSSGKLRIQPDTSLLDDPDAVFPIVLDPGVQRSRAGSYRAMVWSDGQYFINDATAHARVGYDGWQNMKVSRSFYNFDTSGLYGRTIYKAVLRHAQIHSPQGTCNVTHYGTGVQAGVTGGIGAGTRWPGPSFLTLGGVNDFGHGSSASCPDATQVEWEMTGPVRSHASAVSATTLTIGLRGVNEADKYGWRQYDNIAGKMPSLYVEYNTPPGTPSGLTVGGSTSGWATTTTPVLGATFFDADHSSGQSLMGLFQVFAANNVKVWEVTTASLPGASTSATASVSVPASKLADGTTYTFRAASVDKDGAVSGGAQINFTVDLTKPGAVIDSVSGPSGGSLALKGSPVTITGRSSSSDVSALCFTFRTSSPVCKTAAAGVPVVYEVPAASVNEIGPAPVTVFAKDRAGHVGPPAAAQIRVQGTTGKVFWTLDDDPWTTSYDPQGSALSGNALTSAGTVTRVSGRASDIDPADRAIAGSTLRYGPTPVIDTSGSFSVMTWVRPNEAAMTVGAQGSTQVAVSQDVDVAGTRAAFALGSLNGLPSFSVRTAAGGEVALTGQTWDSDMSGWVKLTGVYDADTGTIRLYVNNTEAAVEALTSSAPAKGAVWLGRRSEAGAVSQPWGGDVDWTSVFSTALSATQIANQGA